MFTMALSEMFWVLAKSGTFRDITGAEDGLGFRDVLPESLNPTTTFNGNRMDMYRVTVIFFVLVFLAIRRYMNSPVGRVMLAVRENEQRARTIGYNTLYYKILTMTFSGVIATMSGLLFVIWATDKRVHPEILSLKYTVDPLLNTLIGGVGTLTGPVVAALGLTLGETYLRNETFTLSTKLLGVLAMWQVFVILVVAILMGALRHTLSRGGDRLLRAIRPAYQQGRREYRRFMQTYILGVGVVLLAIGMVIGHQIANDPDLKTKTYLVSDLWELFLGGLFVIVVMALPNGIVGTWNRWRAQRRIRRMERELQAHKNAEHAR
jgi:ABC-type branched-subunit amino acid transport system permease subunit